MSDTNTTVDLAPLADDYDIVGEAGESEFSRSYIATRKNGAGKRRDDSAGVLITVVRTPPGDEGNALLHLASDTKTLSGTTHRRLIPVIEGRWLGDDAFAVVTQRITDPTLAQRLAKGETFSNPRIAAILREVNGLLEWAREQKIVHRTVTPETIHLEPKTDRVRIALAAAPIPRIQPADADAVDARTIAQLATEMLAASGGEGLDAEDSNVLGLRAELPARLAETTKSLLDAKSAATPEDVAAYLAMIGMADPIYVGETEAERIRNEVLEEQRIEREKLANERAEWERKMAEQQACWEKKMADERECWEKKIADEREHFDRAMADERKKLDAERESLARAVAKQRAELERKAEQEHDTMQRAAEKERAAVTALRAELEREVAKQRAELERSAANDRREIEALRARIMAEGQAEVEKKRQASLAEIDDDKIALDEGELATPLFAAPVLPVLPPVVFDDDTPLLADKQKAFEPEEALPPRAEVQKLSTPPVPVAAAATTPAPAADAPVSATSAPSTPSTPAVPPSSPKPRFLATRRQRTVAAASAAVLAVVLGAGALVMREQGSTPPAARPVASKPAPVAAAPASLPPSVVPLPDSTTLATSSGKSVTDSASGAVGTVLDSASAARAEARAAARRKALRDSVAAAREARAARAAREGGSTRPARTLADSLFDFRNPTPVPTVTPTVKRDSTPKPPDSTATTPP